MNCFLDFYSAHLGGTAITVSGTTETGEVRYYPFGTDRYTSGTTPTSFKYTGQRQESGIGLYYYGARWYDPALGRFVQPDTIVPDPGDAKSFDRYAYVLNNPLKYSDPTGYCAVSAVAGPPGLLIDIPCWGSGVAEAAAATVAGVALAPAAASLAVNYVLSEEPVAIPPLYPELAPDAPQGSLLVTIPIPSSTTLVSGIPLVPDETLPMIEGSAPAVPSQQMLADPLVSAEMGSNVVFASNYRKTFFDAYPALEGTVVVHHAIEQQVLTRYPGLFTEDEIHSLDNLRGIPIAVNADIHLSQIRRMWNEFYRNHGNPSRGEVMDTAREIDQMFSNIFLP